MRFIRVSSLLLPWSTFALPQAEQPPQSYTTSSLLGPHVPLILPFPRPGIDIYLKATDNGSAVIVPPLYSLTSMFFNGDYTPQLAEFLEQDLPLNDKSRAWHEWVKNITAGAPPDKPVQLFGSLPFGPGINGMNQIQFLMYQAIGWSLKRCFCMFPGEECDPSEMVYGKLGFSYQAGNLAQFEAVVGMLANETMVAKLEGLKISDDLPSEEDKALAKAADFPLSAAQTMRGQLTRMQYSLYQMLVQGDSRSCPTTATKCGKRSANPCNHYTLNRG